MIKAFDGTVFKVGEDLERLEAHLRKGQASIGREGLKHFSARSWPPRREEGSTDRRDLESRRSLSKVPAILGFARKAWL